MTGQRGIGHALLAVLLLAATLNVTSCGTLLHPERKGQTAGRIDPAIAVLDGVGLLFFIIPGIIAFAVDFSNGTIYLPPGSADARVLPEDLAGMTPVHVPAEALTASGIETLVRERTGIAFSLQNPGLRIWRTADSAPAL